MIISKEGVTYCQAIRKKVLLVRQLGLTSGHACVAFKHGVCVQTTYNSRRRWVWARLGGLPTNAQFIGDNIPIHEVGSVYNQFCESVFHVKSYDLFKETASKYRSYRTLTFLYCIHDLYRCSDPITRKILSMMVSYRPTHKLNNPLREKQAYSIQDRGLECHPS